MHVFVNGVGSAKICPSWIAEDFWVFGRIFCTIWSSAVWASFLSLGGELRIFDDSMEVDLFGTDRISSLSLGIRGFVTVEGILDV